MKKISILLITLFFLSGCSIKYEIAINENLSVDEELVILEYNSVIISNERYMGGLSTDTKIDVDAAIKSLVNYHREKNPSYLFSPLKEDNKSGMKVVKNYTDISFLSNSFIPKELYKGLLIDTNSNIVKLSSILPNKIDDLFNADSDITYDFEKFYVSISLPFVVTKTNAEVIDKKNNIYLWSYDYGMTNKEVILEFDRTKKFSYEEMRSNYIAKIITYVIVVIVVGVIIGFVFLRKKPDFNKY